MKWRFCRGVLALTGLLTFLLVLALYFANRLVSKELWRPFHGTLASLRNYQLEEMQPVAFPETKIAEYVDCSRPAAPDGSIQSDYFTLKEYTENTRTRSKPPLPLSQ
jgi:hypothetical protein